MTEFDDVAERGYQDRVRHLEVIAGLSRQCAVEQANAEFSRNGQPINRRGLAEVAARVICVDPSADMLAQLAGDDAYLPVRARLVNLLNLAARTLKRRI